MKNNSTFNKITKNIIEKIKLNEIEHKKNNLECICLNICSGDKEKFENIKKEIIKKTNLNFSKKFRFVNS